MIRKSRDSKETKTKAETPVVVSEEQVRRFANRLRGTSCCGLGEYSGCNDISSIGDVIAIRLAAYRASRGLVFLTTVRDQESAKRVKALEDGGFKSMESKMNPNSRRQVTIWVARTLSRRPSGYVSSKSNN